MKRERYVSIGVLPGVVRQMRLIVHHKRQYRKLAKIMTAATDASLYVLPYAQKGRFYFGGSTIPEKGGGTFNFTKQHVSLDRIPKLSMHESGRVHIRADGTAMAGPLIVPPFHALRGEHMATIIADTFDGLPLLDGPLRTAGSEQDLVFLIENIESGRIAIYINGAEPSFTTKRCFGIFALGHALARRPVFVGLNKIAQGPFGEPRERDGVLVIGGWNPMLRKAPRVDFLFLRGE